MAETEGAWDRNKSTERTDVNEMYTKWAETYDEDMMDILGCASKDELVKTTMAHIVNDESTMLLDLAAGTGIIGQMFREYGYKGMIDGLEPNSIMLEKAQGKAVYRKYICFKLTSEDEIPVEEGAYDAATVAGALIPYHIDQESLRQAIRPLKRGGILVGYARESGEDYGEYRVKLEKVLRDLVNEGKLEAVEERKILHYRNRKLDNGEEVNVILYTYRKL